jgi:hypothetical protein
MNGLRFMGYQEPIQDFASLSMLIGLLICVGCGSNEQVLKGRAAVSGTVSFDGQPLRGGTISFRAADSHTATTAIIQDEGKYFSDRVPLGSNLVSVETESLKFGNAGAYVEIPGKYADEVTSGLSVDVEEGENTDLNFALTSDN